MKSVYEGKAGCQLALVNPCATVPGVPQNNFDLNCVKLIAMNKYLETLVI